MEEASALHAGYHSLWRRFGCLPERYDLKRGRIAEGAWAEAYPLRPELAESCYALHHATAGRAGDSTRGGERRGSARGGGGGEEPIADGSYLSMGAEMVASINRLMRAPVGFAALSSVSKQTQDDHMASFFLAETLKYLFLLFDEDNFINRHATSLVFTTEGHLIPLSLRFSTPPASPAVRGGAVGSSMDTNRETRARETRAGGVSALVHSEASVTEIVRGLAVPELRSVADAAGATHSDCLEMPCLRERALGALHQLRQEADAAMTCTIPSGVTMSE